MAKKPLFTKDDEPTIDPSLLSEQEVAELQGEVQAEVDADRKEAARKALKARLLKEARQKKGLEEAQETVTIDLAPYTDRILIDNVAYLQGRTYTVPVSRAQVLLEQCQRTWNHQAEIDGKSENFYRRTRGQRILPSGAVTTTSQLLKA